jgi:methylenetetrahydrofolate reductase (NADPH)
MMQPLRERLLYTIDFVCGVELVSTRGTMSEGSAIKVRRFANDLVEHPRVDWISITDNAGGNPMLGPMALGKPILYAGKEAVIHLSCKDFNRNGLEREAWQLASEGFHNILALSGDYPVAGFDGKAKPVFDIDSIGLLSMLRQMNEGLGVRTDTPGKPRRNLSKTHFFTGAVTTNFKLRENEVLPQYLKLEKKIECGAQFIINQIGFDSRKMHELILYLQRRGLQDVPLIGNVYLLNKGVVEFFHQKKIPGVCISEELLARCRRAAQSPDKGRSFFLELAAKQSAICRGLGYRGVYFGGVHSLNDLQAIFEIERGFSPDDWKQFAREIRYSRPGEFFLLDEDSETSLADICHLNPEYEKSLLSRSRSSNADLGYRLSKAMHDVLFTPGRGLYDLGVKIYKGAADRGQGPKFLRALEHLSKAAFFQCKDCGDCSLPDIAYLCPESACAKNQRNGPCGGTRDGKCEVGEFECIWCRAYDRVKCDGKEMDLLAHAPVIQDQGLRGTSSWANAYLQRDHYAKRRETGSKSVPPPASSINDLKDFARSNQPDAQREHPQGVEAQLRSQER